ncbi:MAG: adenylate/guanylate cyclase domain-containing protein [Rhodospirillales bacterium]
MMNYALTNSDPRLLPLMTALTDLGESAPDLAGLVQGYNDKLVSLGLPVDRATTHLGTLHSERIGTGRVWRPGQEVVETHYGFGTKTDQIYLDSPIKTVEQSGAPLEIWPKRDQDPSYAIVPDLRAEGMTHYLAFPLFYSDGTINAASFATKADKGFDSRDQALLEALLPFYTRMLEIKSLRSTIDDILKIYVGREPATQILSGNTKRGQVSRISAAMLIADLRHFTDLSNRISERKLVGVLNDFFDCFVPPIVEQGGEVLKFIGDAVLAIFPQPDGMAPVSSPRERALIAAREGLANLKVLNRGLGEDPASLEAGVALHLGRVAFGNVGSVERLDFTAIGPDVNLVARLATLCGELGQPLLLSERFAKGMNLPLQDLGVHRLKGFVQRQKVFTLDSKAAQLD